MLFLLELANNLCNTPATSALAETLPPSLVGPYRKRVPMPFGMNRAFPDIGSPVPMHIRAPAFQKRQNRIRGLNCRKIMAIWNDAHDPAFQFARVRKRLSIYQRVSPFL